MPEPNGADNTQQRLEQLEQMDKLLLRAQVLQQAALEILQKSVAAHDAWITEARERDQQVNQRIECAGLFGFGGRILLLSRNVGRCA